MSTQVCLDDFATVLHSSELEVFDAVVQPSTTRSQYSSIDIERLIMLCHALLDACLRAVEDVKSPEEIVQYVDIPFDRGCHD